MGKVSRTHLKLLVVPHMFRTKKDGTPDRRYGRYKRGQEAEEALGEMCCIHKQLLGK